ncbi:transcriptional regulator [Natronococcus pandeyae]|uniref:Transcriptional regulator n=1 Tax=Natronococcus pandeyae TaxID=2055836 RepID=A0A8J8PYP4_9EURY|nr:transcriptional regulator [Natronococcus pandeyae]
MYFLTQSPVRVRLLEKLYDEGDAQKYELREAFDTSRVTVRRNLNALEDRDLITISGRTCEISPLGDVVVEDVLPAVNRVHFVERLRPFVRWFPVDDLTFDIRALEDSTIVTANESDPYAPVNRHIEAMENADRFRCLLPAVGLPAMNVARDRVVEDGWQYECIYTPGLASTLRNQPEYAELVDELSEAPNCDLFIAEDRIRYYLGLFDHRVQIGVEDDNGVPKALVDTDAAEVREWAEQTYDHYLEQAEPFIP